jgi:hypothetical protein
MSAIAKLFDAANAIAREFQTCLENVYTKEQYTYSPATRSYLIQKGIDNCSAIKEGAEYKLVNLDPYIPYSLYTRKGVRYGVNMPKVVNELVEGGLHTKYDNKLFDTAPFKAEILSNTNLTAEGVENEYQKKYVYAMLEREVAAKPAQNSVHCLNKATMDAYFHEVKRHYGGADLYPVFYTGDMYKATKPGDYPTHTEYLKCAESRSKMQ